MISALHQFPDGFLWGTSTSSHQVEGGQPPNDWTAWEAQAGRIVNGDTAGEACGWWSGRWSVDFDMAAEHGHNTIRISLEWARIEPRPGQFDQEALSYYRQIVSGARARGLEPMVTLHHFTNPVWFLDLGGWLAAESTALFSRYVEVALRALGDLAQLWVTINEPNVYAYAAYASGEFPPGQVSVPRVLDAMESLVRGHAAAYRTIHRVAPHAQVGMAHHIRVMRPARPSYPPDRWLASARSRLFNDAIPAALVSGTLRQVWRKTYIPEAVGTQDFFGLNYYTRELVRFNPLRPKGMIDLGHFHPDDEVSPTGFIANSPQGFWRALRYAKGFGLPIFITENGVEGEDDRLRLRYIISHLRQLWLAANFSWQIKGYYYWTLVDNFEWERGWTQPFGLWGLDRTTGQRIKRPSAELYAEICRSNAISADMVREYTPELMDSLFPEDPPGDLLLAGEAAP